MEKIMNEKFELFTDEVFVSEARSIVTMLLADVPVAEIATRLNLTEFDVIEVMREVIKEEILN
jgi:hypothetical protein